MNKVKLTPLKKTDSLKIIDMPGSKSYTNRALLLAALTENPVLIKNPLKSDDTESMVNCLQELGIKVAKQGEDLLVFGSYLDVQDKNFTLNCNLAATTLRFLTALCCILPGTKVLFGRPPLHKRPIKDLVNTLKEMGAKIEYLENPGYPPLKITSSKLEAKQCKINGNISSQFLSSILHIAPLIGDFKILVENRLISRPYINMTIDTMKAFGVTLKNLEYKEFYVAKQKYHCQQYLVEGDYSAAGYFLAISALTGLRLNLKNLSPQSVQGDMEFLTILESQNCSYNWTENGLIFEGQADLKPISVNMENCPDQAQTLAVLMAFAEGKSVLTGVSSLRVKETERVKAVQSQLLKMNIKTESNDKDTLIIYGGKPNSATIETFHDQRMAMSFAVAGAVLKNIIIEDYMVVSKTFPLFWEKLKLLGIQINPI